MSNKNNFLMFFGIIILSIILTPLLGNLYEYYLGPASHGYLTPDHPEYVGGFTFAFIFFASLITWIVVDKKYRIKYWLSYSLPLLAFMLLLGAIEEFIIGLGMLAIGWVLAVATNKFKSKIFT